MATLHKLAVIIKNSSNEDEFLVVKQTRPPRFDNEEYDSFVDSDLWDLPCTELNLLEGDIHSNFQIEGAQKFDFRRFDVNSAVNQILLQVGYESVYDGKWEFWKFVEEPEFGPGPPVHTVFITGKLMLDNLKLPDISKWMPVHICLNLLLEVKQSNDRIGPLMVAGFSDHLPQSRSSCTLPCQEYPPGVKIVPMRCKTAKPFHTTNLVIIAPDNGFDGCCGDTAFAAYGDALIVDPGCRSEFHEQLTDIVAALPRKLVVFVTHHHYDHVEGLSAVQKCNPDAILLAHQNTLTRIRKGDWSSGYTTVSGAEEICIGGQRLKIIFAPGHTDGHLALLHVSTQSLIVGDHCVGQGSALLDINSGGNMKDYFQTTYNFLDLSPHVLIPMHGRVNTWPKHLLCGYLKNRRNRESTILKAIESGAETLYAILSKTYAEVDPALWIHASSNLRLHVDHLAQQQKLPKEFSVEKFKRTCGLHFFSRWMWMYLRSGLLFKDNKSRKIKVFSAIAVAGFAVLYGLKSKLYSK